MRHERVAGCEVVVSHLAECGSGRVRCPGVAPCGFFQIILRESGGNAKVDANITHARARSFDLACCRMSKCTPVLVQKEWSLWSKGLIPMAKRGGIYGQKRCDGRPEKSCGVICGKKWRQLYIVLASIHVSFGANTHGWPREEKFWPHGESVCPRRESMLST